MADAPTERRPRTALPRGNDGKPPVPGGGQAPQRMPRMPGSRNFWLLIVVLLVLNYAIVGLLAPGRKESVTIPYSPTFLAQVTSNNVKRISTEGEAVSGEFKKEVRYPNDKAHPVMNFTTQLPTFVVNDPQTSKTLFDHKVEVAAKPINQGRGFFYNLILGFGPVILLVVLFVWLSRRAAGGQMGALGSFGRSRARRVEGGDTHVTFSDVAGIDEAKSELTEVVDFLKNPERYQRLGGRIPRGVLLSGAPGTGKTLLARAVAGEAGVPFFSLSASEFVEAIVGIGASRVRDLFRQAKEASPAIIFIDELDAIGRSRSSGTGPFSGGNEREQTLNQILTEMDGFDSATSLIVIAATNRAEVLDPALLRPGRFDRRVNVQPPDTNGRRKILEVHTRSVPLDDSVDLEAIASTTVGMVGADLANLANEAALTAARVGHDKVTQEDFTNALDRIVLGSERKIMMSQHDRERTAYHESGHALVGMLTPGADPVRKVSIIPRGPALGVTLSAPEADRFSYDRPYLLGRIKVALAGRVAEKLIYGEITTGAESDIEQLTQIARQMVGRWGMSDAVGPIAVIPRDGQGPLLPGTSEVSAETHRLIDEEVRRLVEGCENEVRSLLSENRHRLDALVRGLLEKETLDQDEAYRVAGVDRPPTEPLEELETVRHDAP